MKHCRRRPSSSASCPFRTRSTKSAAKASTSPVNSIFHFLPLSVSVINGAGLLAPGAAAPIPSKPLITRVRHRWRRSIRFGSIRARCHLSALMAFAMLLHCCSRWFQNATLLPPPNGGLLWAALDGAGWRRLLPPGAGFNPALVARVTTDLICISLTTEL